MSTEIMEMPTLEKSMESEQSFEEKTLNIIDSLLTDLSLDEFGLEKMREVVKKIEFIKENYNVNSLKKEIEGFLLFYKNRAISPSANDEELYNENKKNLINNLKSLKEQVVSKDIKKAA